METGPALQNPLPKVLIRWREYEWAWAADIEAMHSRFRLRPEDRRYHRFLWPEEDGTISTCEMQRLTFGVSCAPFIAIHTTRRVVIDAGPGHDLARDAIWNDFYIDDYLGSAKTEDETLAVTNDVDDVLVRVDLHLTGWMSNSIRLRTARRPVVLQSDGDAYQLRPEDTEPVLGMLWRPNADVLGFRTVWGLDDVVFTRIGLLSLLARLFDPLGLAAPLTVQGKDSFASPWDPRSQLARPHQRRRYDMVEGLDTSGREAVII